MKRGSIWQPAGFADMEGIDNYIPYPIEWKLRRSVRFYFWWKRLLSKVLR